MNNFSPFMSRKITKILRFVKYVFLSLIFVLLAVLRWGSNDTNSDKEGNLSFGKDLKSFLPKVHADVPGGPPPGDGDGGGDDGGDGGGDGGC